MVDLLTQIFERLSECEARFLRSVLPASMRKQFRERDAAICRLGKTQFSHLALRPRANAIASELVRRQFRTSREGHEPNESLAAAVVEILAFNDGQPLGWRRIYDILEEDLRPAKPLIHR